MPGRSVGRSVASFRAHFNNFRFCAIDRRLRSVQGTLNLISESAQIRTPSQRHSMPLDLPLQPGDDSETTKSVNPSSNEAEAFKTMFNNKLLHVLTAASTLAKPPKDEISPSLSTPVRLERK